MAPKIFEESTRSTLAELGFNEMSKAIELKMKLLEVSLGKLSPIDFIAQESKKKAVTKKRMTPALNSRPDEISNASSLEESRE